MGWIVRVSEQARGVYTLGLDAHLRDELREQVALVAEAPEDYLFRAMSGADLWLHRYTSSQDPRLVFTLSFANYDPQERSMTLLTIGRMTIGESEDAE